jgi:methylated-DNA-[protein]-cysteine S-methyltransferase
MYAELYRSTLDTPVGRLGLAVDEHGSLIELWLPNRRRNDTSLHIPSQARAGMNAAKAQLGEYFSGRLRAFDLPLHPHGSGFERRVWKRLCEIPYGSTTSYGAIAAELGLVNGARAVGRANGSNPIPIVIPCHRVIGSDGTLTGYGGGLELKRTLLELEGSLQAQELRLL